MSYVHMTKAECIGGPLDGRTAQHGGRGFPYALVLDKGTREPAVVCACDSLREPNGSYALLLTPKWGPQWVWHPVELTVSP